MISYIIFKQESVKAVIIDDEKFAQEEIERLAKEDYEKHFKNLSVRDYGIYRSIVKWHIETVKVSNKEEV